MRRLVGLSVALLVLLALGCGGDFRTSQSATKDTARDDAGKPPAAGEKLARQAAGQIQPKIIYTAHVDLVVEKVDEAREQMLALLKEHGGHRARSEEVLREGRTRHDKWTLRVPAEKLESFLTALEKLGEVRRRALESDDVTDRYYDVAAEIKNLEASEAALQKLYDRTLANANAKATEILEIKREADRIRGEINVRKGQIARWDKLTEYSTVILSIQDRRAYVPPEAADFGSTVRRTFRGSVEALVEFGKGLVYVLVAVAPWLPVLFVVVFLPGWLAVRRWRSSRRSGPPELPHA